MNKPYMIGVAGGSGSGKTFFLKCFLKHFTSGEVSLLSQDDYYIPVAHNMTAEENKHYNFDLPHTIDSQHFTDDVTSLLNRKSIIKTEYTFNNPNAIPKTLEIQSAPIIIVEGLFILHFKEIANMLDYKIFIDTEEDVALQPHDNGLVRDLTDVFAMGGRTADVRHGGGTCVDGADTASL